MNVDNEKIKRIIVKSVLGTLTEEENFVLEEWFQENDRNRVLYQKLSSTVELKHKYKQYRRGGGFPEKSTSFVSECSE